MIDVGVSDYDLLHLQIVFPDQREDLLEVVARIDHHGFARILITDQGAITLQRPHRKNFVDHENIVTT